MIYIKTVLKCIAILGSNLFRVEGDSSGENSSIYDLIPVECQAEEFIEDIPVFYSNQYAIVYVYGNNLNPDLQVGITKQTTCEYVNPAHLELEEETSNSHIATLSFITPPTQDSLLKNVPFYICLKKSGGKWIYQESYKEAAFYVYEPLLSTLNQIIVIVLCFALSSVLTGLNLGVLSLNLNELYLFKNAGTMKERKYAKKIIPIRSRGNYFLSSIVITSTMCNAIATVFIKHFVSSWVTVTLSTIFIVLFCEILPQSICSYFPLTIAARTVYITIACMVLTAPASYPLAKFLDCVIGKEIPTSYTKTRLKELLKMSGLPSNEERIISGTLDLSQKKVEDIMTMLDDIFKLPKSAIMDFETIALILATGYSRIPIYDGNKSNICHVVLTKDLALLDPDDKVPITVLIEHSKYNCHYIEKGTTLDNALGMFKGSRNHMIFIVDDNITLSDKEQHVIGLITFEDIIEEIFQTEINDETDTFSDNRNKQRLTGIDWTHDFLLQLKTYTSESTAPTENLKLATFHFLSGIDLFSSDYISPKVLLALLGLDIFYSTPGLKSPQDNIYIQGVPVDYFVMIIQGLMEVKIGTEDFKFEAEPFRYFGTEALRQGTEQLFTPDYTLQAIKKSMYLKISRTLYEAAILATRFEMFKEIPDISLKSDIYRYFNLIVGSDINIKGSKLD